RVPLPRGESAYGDPEAGQTVVNVTDGKILRLLVDDEPFDVRYGTLCSHERTLDLRAGTLRREAVWESPNGRRVRIRSTRLVSCVQRAVAAIAYEVEPFDDPAHLVIQSELVANEPPPATDADPRAASALRSPLRSEASVQRDALVVLGHVTAASGLRMAAGMDHVVEGPEGTEVVANSGEDLGRVTIAADVRPGQRLRVVKFLAYGWSGQRSKPAVTAQVEGALFDARHTGWDGLTEAQRSFLDLFWSRADVELEGDARLQQAVRFAYFHVLQAGVRGERRAIPAKGLTGPGYDGHTFWDTERFVLPVLTYALPYGAADALRWRQSTLPLARKRAAELGLRGAAFPWRTITGEESSTYWPASTAQFHINADVADAVVRYCEVTGDEEFELEVGMELLVETARLWASLGSHRTDGAFRIDGVTGPDEYSAVADNNLYTNLMAQRNLEAAARAVSRHPDKAVEMGVSAEETASWQRAATAIFIPYDKELAVHQQSEGFTAHERWDFSATSPEQYPLFLHFPYFQLYRRQVVKQADLVLALQAFPDAFSAEQKRRDFEYYEALTVRDSSLSASVQAIVAADVGHLELAYDYFREAALLDLEDLQHNTRDGLHIASLAGACRIPARGFGGMRRRGGTLAFSPRLPEALARVKFRVKFGAQLLSVEIFQGLATYTLIEGPPITIFHHERRVEIHADEAVTRAIPPLEPVPSPSQPPGRAPVGRALDPTQLEGQAEVGPHHHGAVA
ncbi:MAG TPA: glycosyl hydrolase family 65 protein, partial [Acidimicrobiales bacterium]|nr:glycosyl hydrolase family 65 protein [Acidimicrobiales bacterium]